MQTNDNLNSEFHSHLVHKFAWLFTLRPMQLATFLIRVLAPDERRRIVSTAMGIRLYLDPFSHLGQEISMHHVYEAETTAIFRTEISAGQIILDIGANEGVFTTLAGAIVGKKRLVIAIEPQSRLRDVIEINVRINHVENFKIYQKAFGGKQGAKIKLGLYPGLNTGASSQHY